MPSFRWTRTSSINGWTFIESSNSQWFGRYSWTDESTLQTPIGMTVDNSTIYTRASQWMLSNTRVLASNKTNETRFGYSSIYNVIGQQLAGQEDVDKEIGVPISLPTGNLWGVPQIGLSNSLTSFGNTTNGPYIVDNKYFQAIDNFSWIRGKHSLRFGGEYRYDEFPSFGNEFTTGVLPAIPTIRLGDTPAPIFCWERPTWSTWR